MQCRRETNLFDQNWKRLIKASALALILSGFLTACSGDSDDDPDPTNPDPNPPTTPEEPDDGGDTGGDDGGDDGGGDDGGNDGDDGGDSGDDTDTRFLGTAPGDEGDYEHILSYFNQITPENAGKWGSVESERDVMNWTELDTAYNYAKQNDLEFKFHVLVWGQQQPDWLGALTPEEQLAEVDEWMAAVADRYPDLTMVEVVNEALPDHAPAGYKDALGGDGETGYDWVIKSFEMAREHFPEAELMLNDYQILHLDQFTQNYLKIIKPLQERELIDGIGVQAHFLERTDAATVKANLDTLAETGLPIYISEFDLDLADDARHANQFKELFPVFWEHPAVAGVTLWGHREGSMWKEGGYLINADGTEREAMVWLQCYLDGRTDCTVPEYVPAGWQGNEYGVTLEAELFDEGEGVLALGSTISYVDGGDWVGFTDVEIQDTYNTFWITYARNSDVPSNVSVHLGSLDSTAILDVDLPSTGSWSTSETLELPLDITAGTYDVFLKFNGTIEVGNVDSVRFGQPLPESTVNLVHDGGFEGSSLTGWGTWTGSTLELSGDMSYKGSQSLLITGRSDNGNASYSLTDVVSAGTTYTVSAYAMHTGGANDTLRLAATVECSDPPAEHNSHPWIHNVSDVASNTWTQLSGSLVIPECDVTNVNIFFEGTSETVDVYVDEVVVSPPGENLISDGGFETGIAGWGIGWMGAELAASTAQAHSGDQSLLVTSRDEAGDLALYTLTSLVEGNTTYDVNAWFLHTGTVDDQVQMTAKVQCVDGEASYVTLANPDDMAPIAPDTWTQVTGELVIPDCDPAEVLLYFENTSAGTDFHLDDVSVMAN